MEVLSVIKGLIQGGEYEIAKRMLLHIAGEVKDIEEINRYISIIENGFKINEEFLLDFLEDYIEYVTDDCE